MRCRLPRITATLLATASASLLVAACGASSPSSPSASSSGSRPTLAQAQQDVVNFTDCMRTHGVPNFPDPTTDPRKYKGAFNTQSPAFKSAAASCQHLLPGGGVTSSTPTHSQAQIAAMLSFAGCMRRHGFASFPDPTTSGSVTHEMLANAGISLNQPALVPAADACTGVTHGFITRAIVARFVAGH